MAFCAMRSVHTAWCDQISTPAENQLRLTVPSTDTVLLPLSLVSTNRHDADRSPLPERRGNNAPAQPMIASKLELSPCAVSVLGQLFVEGPTSDKARIRWRRYPPSAVCNGKAYQ